jgi:hypothetical protein
MEYNLLVREDDGDDAFDSILLSVADDQDSVGVMVVGDIEVVVVAVIGNDRVIFRPYRNAKIELK